MYIAACGAAFVVLSGLMIDLCGAIVYTISALLASRRVAARPVSSISSSSEAEP